MKIVPVRFEINPKTGHEAISFFATKRTGSTQESAKMSTKVTWFEQTM